MNKSIIAKSSKEILTKLINNQEEYLVDVTNPQQVFNLLNESYKSIDSPYTTQHDLLNNLKTISSDELLDVFPVIAANILSCYFSKEPPTYIGLYLYLIICGWNNIKNITLNKELIGDLDIRSPVSLKYFGPSVMILDTSSILNLIFDTITINADTDPKIRDDDDIINKSFRHVGCNKCIIDYDIGKTDIALLPAGKELIFSNKVTKLPLGIYGSDFVSTYNVLDLTAMPVNSNWRVSLNLLLDIDNLLTNIANPKNMGHIYITKDQVEQFHKCNTDKRTGKLRGNAKEFEKYFIIK